VRLRLYIFDVFKVHWWYASCTCAYFPLCNGRCSYQFFVFFCRSIYYDFDVTLLELTDALTFNAKVRPVCFPQNGFTVDENLPVILTGFGRLRKTMVVLINNKLWITLCSNGRHVYLNLGSSVCYECTKFVFELFSLIYKQYMQVEAVDLYQNLPWSRYRSKTLYPVTKKQKQNWNAKIILEWYLSYV